MAKTKRRKDLLGRLSRQHLAIIAAFVLTFVSFGSWFVYRSEASGGCTSLSLYFHGTAGYSTGWCVRVLQDSLGVLHAVYPTRVVPPYGVDGIYGPNTHNSVASFQRNMIPGQTSNDGNISANGATWRGICSRLLSIYLGAGNSSWLDNEAGTDYNWLGCR